MLDGAFVVWCNGSGNSLRFAAGDPFPVAFEPRALPSANCYAVAFPESLHHATKVPPRMRMSLNTEEGGALQKRCRSRLPQIGQSAKT